MIRSTRSIENPANRKVSMKRSIGYNAFCTDMTLMTSNITLEKIITIILEHTNEKVGDLILIKEISGCEK